MLHKLCSFFLTACSSVSQLEQTCFYCTWLGEAETHTNDADCRKLTKCYPKVQLVWNGAGHPKQNKHNGSSNKFGASGYNPIIGWKLFRMMHMTTFKLILKGYFHLLCPFSIFCRFSVWFWQFLQLCIEVIIFQKSTQKHFNTFLSEWVRCQSLCRTHISTRPHISTTYLCDYWFDRGMNSLAYLVASSIVPVCFDAG